MAKLMLIGDVAQVELTSDPEDGGTIATCYAHEYTAKGELMAHSGCGWAVQYDTLDDASEYASDHADRGRWMNMRSETVWG